MTYMRASNDEFEIRPDPTPDHRLPALERPKIDVATFSRLFFIQSFSYLQVTMVCIRARRSSKICQFRPPTPELVALECLKKIPIDL